MLCIFFYFVILQAVTWLCFVRGMGQIIARHGWFADVARLWAMCLSFQWPKHDAGFIHTALVHMIHMSHRIRKNGGIRPLKEREYSLIFKQLSGITQNLRARYSDVKSKAN